MRQEQSPAGNAFSGEVSSERRSFGFIRRFAPHFAQDDRAGLGLSTGVSGIYAQHGSFIRRFAITTNAIVILPVPVGSKHFRTNVRKCAPNDIASRAKDEPCSGAVPPHQPTPTVILPAPMGSATPVALFHRGVVEGYRFACKR